MGNDKEGSKGIGDRPKGLDLDIEIFFRDYL